ncbi:hydroxyacid dehydrogenase [Agromyces atrinae]|uniref:Hydroxyacid dehydrogenase n=1 Tax=Agromyces atrinae TaxID=592376 RepID=A0A4V1R2T7_9MICO|nr:hydroxyacid dehydrogenase [Agromyces atrinae]NYD67481.1 phosphoglycerate dehydrogenase-like enzyme [Agromyces atrinae]RXZ88296.1 hydroxyacid dehydrogenase [Agromyces atrinae]
MVVHVAADRVTDARMSALLLMPEWVFDDLFDPARRERLARLIAPTASLRFDDLESAEARLRLAEADVLVTGWGTPALDASVLAAAPRLRAVVHTGGSVKNHLAAAFWDHDIIVTSAADANAIPVAEFTLATILLEGKRTAQYVEGYRRHREVGGSWRNSIPPAVNFGGTVGIVGLSRVGRRVAELLRPFDLEVLVADPYVDAASAAAVGARLVELDDLMIASDIVSVHAPELPETRNLIDARRLDLLKRDAVIVNTARGSLIDTSALIERCRAGTLRAVLDVTDPEPLPADSPLFTTPGIVLSPHIAGAMHTETYRLADSALDEIERLAAGRPPLHRVDGASLGIIA